LTNNGCTATDASSKPLSDPESPITTNDVTICEGTAFKFERFAALDYAFAGPNSFTSTNQNSSVSSSANGYGGRLYRNRINTGACTASGYC
jgi:hypothetical protein